MTFLIKDTDVAVIRSTPSPETYDGNGKIIPPSTESLCLKGAIFPITEEEMQLFPEGTQLDSVFKVRTYQPLKQNDANQIADIVVIAGKQYQVIRCGDWTSHQTPYFIPKFYKSAVQLL